MSLFSWLPWLKKDAHSHLEKKLLSFQPHQHPLTDDERGVFERIRKETEKLNRNNITRTMAYFHLYQRTPEMEWALLAHLVSRNAGWNMSDLKGEWISRLLPSQVAQDYFRFMERANWLIFQDAYPQLLLYEHSKEKHQNFFHLLPFFYVSSFMQVIWNDYWENPNREQLAISLVINEQYYIEQRVIDQESYSAPVIRDIKFHLEDWLDLNMILFPFQQGEDERVLYGKQVDSFPDLQSRIELGKTLYSLLFSPSILPGVLHWCNQSPHTGSRQDYWANFFSPYASENLKQIYRPRFHHGRREKGEPFVYSPFLIDVWPDQKHEKALIKDWFQDPKVVDLLHFKKADLSDVQEEYSQLIDKLEALVQAKQMVESIQ